MTDNTQAQDAIVIERFFDAPIELVWQLWTQPEHFKNWYGPNGFTVPVAEIDLRIGGKHLFCMQSPDGSMKMWSTGEYLEITPYTRLVYIDAMSDEKGNLVSPESIGMPANYPTQTQVIIELETIDNRTKMTLTHAGVPENDGANAGWNQAFDKLANYLLTVSD